MDHLSAERIARNNAAFRHANEQIREQAQRRKLRRDELISFICECADESCTTILRLTFVEYELVRMDSRQFLSAVGHDAAGRPAEVAFANGHYLVTKRGRTRALNDSRPGTRFIACKWPASFL